MIGDRVYFIKPVGFDGPVKIGCSKWPNGRRISLGSWCPFPLEIMAEIEGGYGLERRFHALFGHHHKQREWFDWSSKMAEVVAAINASDFDIETLPAPQSLPSARGGKQKALAAAKRKLATPAEAGQAA